MTRPLVIAATLFLTTLVSWTQAQQGCSVTNAVLESNEIYTLTSINFPGPYPSTTSYYCTFTGTAPTGHKILMYCDSFELLYTPQCNSVWLAFSASGDETFVDSLRYCGFYNTLSLQTTGNKFAMAFVNDYYLSSNPYTGYQCYVVAVPESTTPPPTAAPTTQAPTTKAPTTKAPTTKAPTTKAPTTQAPTPPPATCSCGIKYTGSRIVGGTFTTVHEYPWMVALVGATTGTPFCGGTLIDNQWVLTASHCLDGFSASDIVIRLGEHQVDSGSETFHTINSTVAEIFVHEDYDEITVDNDIGLVKLSSPVTFTDQIAPACLPFKFPKATFNGRMATVTGWGTTTYQGTVSNILQEISLPVVGKAQCENFSSVAGSLTDNMFCTYEAGKDSCQGDSGGPLVYEQTGRQYLIGVVSWGKGCAQVDNPGVYAKVNNYLGWIEDKTSATFCKV